MRNLLFTNGVENVKHAKYSSASAAKIKNQPQSECGRHFETSSWPHQLSSLSSHLCYYTQHSTPTQKKMNGMTVDEEIENHCQQIFENLLSSQKQVMDSKKSGDNENNSISCDFIRKMQKDTPKCDVIHDFSIVRMAFESKLSKLDKKRTERILKNEENESDKKVATEVCHYYREWTEHESMQALKWDSWMYYKTKKVKELFRKVFNRNDEGDE